MTVLSLLKGMAPSLNWLTLGIQITATLCLVTPPLR